METLLILPMDRMTGARCPLDSMISAWGGKEIRGLEIADLLIAKKETYKIFSGNLSQIIPFVMISQK